VSEAYNYVPRDVMVPFHNRTARWAVIIAHRRLGKSTALLNDLIIRGMVKRKDGLRQQFAFLAPFQNQARMVIWQMAKDYTQCFSKCPGYKISEMNLTVTLPDPDNLNNPGSVIMLLGAENAEKLRGLFLDGLVLDEFQDIAPWVGTQSCGRRWLTGVVLLCSQGQSREETTPCGCSMKKQAQVVQGGFTNFFQPAKHT